jgi:hypothetical protein
LFTLDQAVAAEAKGMAPVLLYGLDGFVDAGIVAGLAISDVVAHGDARRVATFDVDNLVDYRARRPPMVIGEHGWEAVHTPELAVDLVRDADGTGFLLMYGPEPDVRWEAFAGAVGDLAVDLNVSQAIGVHGVPAPSPHTRPLRVSSATSGAAPIHGQTPRAKLQVPGSAQALIDFRLGERGIDSTTVLAHIPHYLAVLPYPAGSVALLEQVGRLSALHFDLSRLAAAAAETGRDIARQIDASQELEEMVRDLERRHDERAGAQPLALPGEVLPDAETIAAELEAFLAEQPGAEGTGNRDS